MANIDIFTAAAAFLAGGLFIHFFGVRRTRVRTLEKALQESCLKYAMALEQGRKELEEYRGERLVFKGIINSDTQRAERLMKDAEELKHRNYLLGRLNLVHYHGLQDAYQQLSSHIEGTTFSKNEQGICSSPLPAICGLLKQAMEYDPGN